MKLKMNTHTHMELARDNEGELGECPVTRCEQQDSLLQEWRETLSSLEADRDQVGSVAPCELGGASAVNGYTRSLGGMEAPEPLVVARIPSALVPVCVVTCVVSKCVLKRAHSLGEMACVDEMARVSNMVCVGEMACVSERLCMEEARCVRETPCVRSRYEREMAVGMREGAAASPSESDMAKCVSVMARGSAFVKLRRRRRQTRDKGRVAAVAVLRTVPDSHSSARESRAVLRTRPPRARLRE